MFLARVTGHVVATAKDKTLNGQKLFVVEPLNVRYDEATGRPAALGNTGRAIVALDTVGSPEFSATAEGEASWWLTETRRRVRALTGLASDYLPWVLPRFAPLFELPQLHGVGEMVDEQRQAQAACPGPAINYARPTDAPPCRHCGSIMHFTTGSERLSWRLTL